MSPYSVIVLLGPVIKEIFASRCHSFKIKLEGWNFQGMPQICQKITVLIGEAKFQLLNKKPSYHPTLRQERRNISTLHSSSRMEDRLLAKSRLSSYRSTSLQHCKPGKWLWIQGEAALQTQSFRDADPPQNRMKVIEKRNCLCRELFHEARFKTKTIVCGENLFLNPDLRLKPLSV